MEWLVGILMIGCGVFLLVYGGMLFRFSLAVGLFILGYSLASWLFSAMDPTMQFIISLVVGAILALIGFTMVRLALHLAGGVLGAVLVLILASLLPGSMPSWLVIILVVAGAGVIGFFGNRLGDWVIIFATTLAGAYAVILGLTEIFPQAVTGVDAAHNSAQIPFTGPAFAVFLTVLAIGVLAQWQIRAVRGRYVN